MAGKLERPGVDSGLTRYIVNVSQQVVSNLRYVSILMLHNDGIIANVS